MSNVERAELVTAAWKIASPAATGDYKVRHLRKARIALAVHAGEQNVERLVSLALD